MDPTDKSIPDVMITIVIPNDMIAMNDTFSITVNMFSTVKNSLVVTPKNTTIAMSIRNIPASLALNSFFHNSTTPPHRCFYPSPSIKKGGEPPINLEILISKF
jgi:hypothetical protein